MRNEYDQRLVRDWRAIGSQRARIGVQMLITAAICLPLGLVLGIKFNLKMIMHAIVAAALFFSFVALTGAESIGSALVNWFIAGISLQAGFFSSLMISALGLVSFEERASSIDETTTISASKSTKLGEHT